MGPGRQQNGEGRRNLRRRLWRRLLLFGVVVAAGIGALETWVVLRARGGDTAPAHPQLRVAAVQGPRLITAFGRLEPKDGVIRVAGPSQPVVVLSELLVEEGDAVRVGQVIAILDCFASRKASVARLEAELKNARNEYQRHEDLYRQGIESVSLRDEWQTKVTSLGADLDIARAELDLATVHAPISGQVIKIHARAGERVGLDGIAELGQTDAMYAIAEVYETDITRVRRGQQATITSPALPEELSGTVEHIGLRIGKMDVLHTDPAADTDARVVEVKVRLDDGALVAGLTNLRVDVAINP